MAGLFMRCDDLRRHRSIKSPVGDKNAVWSESFLHLRERFQNPRAVLTQTCRTLQKQKPSFSIWPEFFPTRTRTRSVPWSISLKKAHRREDPTSRPNTVLCWNRYPRSCSWLLLIGGSARRTEGHRLQLGWDIREKNGWR